MDKILWEDKPSQISNFWTYLLFFWTIIPPIIVYLNTKFIKYELDSQRLKIKKGILSQSIEETELYRVKDYSILKPLFLRLFGLGNLVLTTSDKNNKYVTLKAIKDVEKIKDLVRTHVETARKRTGTKEVDFT
jgi:uncharacterized membrane protein YdbT with pleckstrin-like domain|tara:strand:+ start:258 stop:656 length:399 start_codon:yes stop_codon:yes gene_type:complete